MKAVKISKIVWDLSSINDTKKKDEIEMKLPKFKGFKANDDFNITEMVPVILKKKYGYPITEFSFAEFHIPNNINELFETFKPKSMKTDQFFKKGGKLNPKGEVIFDIIKNNIKQRIDLESKEVEEINMPQNLDVLMLGIEHIFGIKWEGKSYNQIMNPIMKKLKVDDIDECSGEYSGE